jgi:hypothetical protein
MLDFNTGGLLEGADEIEEITDGIDSFRSRAGSDSYRRAIASESEAQLYETVLPAVTRAARRHVGGHARDIDAVDVGWNGREYSIGLSTNSAIVKSHEYGSGRYNTRGGRTGGSVNGYRITPEDDDGPLVFQIGGQTVFAESAVHPGVEPKGFMTNSVSDSADDVLDAVADAVAEQLREAIS